MSGLLTALAGMPDHPDMRDIAHAVEGAQRRTDRRLRARQVDGVGVTRGSLAGSRLDEAPGVRLVPFFRQLADPRLRCSTSAAWAAPLA